MEWDAMMRPERGDLVIVDDRLRTYLGVVIHDDTLSQPWSPYLIVRLRSMDRKGTLFSEETMWMPEELTVMIKRWDLLMGDKAMEGFG